VLSVISASTDNIEIMHELMRDISAAKEVSTDSLRPEQWLQTFYDNRKGSGKSKPAHTRQSARNASSAAL
jgi:type IV secretion system protein VirB4